MKRKFFVLLAVIMMVSVVSITAFATPPEDAGGDWYYMPTILGVKVAGGNTFLTISDIGNWKGTFDGESEDCAAFPFEVCALSEDYGTVVIHRSGLTFYKGVNTFPAVTVDGKMGRLEMRVNGSKPVGSDWQGHWVITNAEGDLAGLHGQGTWWGPGYNPEIPELWGEIHYSGNIHFGSD
ncbi:MAG: hypothetical protein GY807_19290 [Gammaproteobacteria bacterium]|nr:hypothetical protein [Gammaproteobacteria bacterium]